MPLNTRAGSAEAPIEPGARTLCEPCDLGPAAKLWRLAGRMPVTKQGPASMTVTRSTRPSSGSKTWVMPIFLPSSPAMTSDELNLDVDARRQVVQPLERVHRLRGGLQDVDQPLVGPDLEVLA